VGWLLLGFVAWAVASPVWAEDRVLTLTRVAVFGILCLAAVAIVRRFTLREIILWALFSSAAYVVVGILVELMFGAFQPLASGYRFAGTLHPNSQGINCAVLLLSAVAAAKVERRGLTFLRICAFVGFVFLVLTASRTAFASVLLALSVYFAVVYSRRAKLAMAYALSILLCILVLSLGNAFLPDVKSAVNLGRVDSTEGTFNGRTGIWDAIGHYVVQRPILGYGFGGFWTPAHIRAISEEEKWGIPNSHSAYLDYLLTLGSVGVAAYALLLFAGIWRALRFQKLSRNTALAFCWMLLVFCAMDGFLESAAANPSLPMLLSLVVLIFLAGMNDAQASRFHDPSRRIPILDRLA
jgi:O-antigen ligase